MKRIVCAAAAAVIALLCFSLISCSKPTVVGKWEMKVDGGTFALKGARGSDDARFSGTVTTYVTFGEDGKYTVSADADSVAAFLRENLAAFIENATENAGRKMTVGEYMETAKVANEDALAALFVPEIAAYGAEGEYSYEDGTITFSESGEVIKIAADLSKKELVLKETVAGKSSGIVRESDFPLTLKRVG